MFNLFVRKDKDVVAEATMKANREVREEDAIDQFLEILSKDENTVESLRDTYRAAIDELCDKTGITDSERRRSIHRQMWTAFPQNLRVTVGEYLHEQKYMAAALHTTNRPTFAMA